MKGQPAINLISVKDVGKYLNDSKTVFIDLRDREAFKREHIGHAFCLSLDRIQNKKYCLSREYHYILYCDHGGSSLEGAMLLQKEGFNVSSLAGGMYEYDLYKSNRKKS